MEMDYDFKRTAVGLAKEVGIEKTAQILGISQSVIEKWQETDAKDSSSEIQRLLYELAEAKKRIQLMQTALNQAFKEASAAKSASASMLTIKTAFSLFRINLDEEFSITTVDCYEGDEYGIPISDESKADAYEWGTILIETKNKRYRFKRVCDAYLWTAAIVQCISKHSGSREIMIDMQRLRTDNNGVYIPCECSSVTVEEI